MSNSSVWNPIIQLRLSDALCPITPLDHQTAAWEAMSQHYLNLRKQSGVLVMPTGGGKTVVAVRWLLQNHVRGGGRVLWLAHRRTLLRQAFSTFCWLGNAAYPRETLNLIAISAIDASWSSVDKRHDAVFASIQSVLQSDNMDFLEAFVDDSEHGVFVVIDEAHHAPAPGYYRVLRRLKERGCQLLGMTATPVRGDEDDRKRLASLFDESIVYQVNRQRLIDDNVLAAMCFETVRTGYSGQNWVSPEDWSYLQSFGELAQTVLTRLGTDPARNTVIVDQYLAHHDRYGPTIVFAADTAHCRALTEEFWRAGVDADYVTYDRSDAQTVISRYQREGKPDVLVNVEMLTEGFDAPHTRTVFIARPTQSEVMVTQMIGRASRGTRINGNDTAFLVTFLDTWSHFNVLDPQYVLEGGEDVVVEVQGDSPTPRIAIPVELVDAAYRVMCSLSSAYLAGFFQCLPHGWFIWWDTFEDDQQQRTVMIFENQREGFDALLAEFDEPAGIPEDVSEDFARQLIQRHFADVPDPLPHWTDIKALLDAKRKGCEIHRYSFEDKRRFDPKVLAQKIIHDNMPQVTMRNFLRGIWDRIPACGFVYRDNFHGFLEDVSREVMTMLDPLALPPPEPEIERILPPATPRAWEPEEPGRDLHVVLGGMVARRQHFPGGLPRLDRLRWMEHPNRSLLAVYRSSDHCLCINPELNSPDVPLFALEFLLYRALLQADMPYSGRNAEFRARERQFQPSPAALQEAEQKGIRPASTTGVWRARAVSFFTSLNRWTGGEFGSIWAF